MQKHLQRLSGAVLWALSTLGGVMVLALAGNVLLGVWARMQPVHPDRRTELPVYEGLRWAGQYGLDQAAFYKGSKKEARPYTLWKRGPFSSSYVNVDSTGLRVTPKRPDADAVRVFVFGGSTVWGTGSPDSLTIPAQLQRLLGPRYDVYNYGESAFVHAQGQQLLLEELSKGNVPHMAVFLDGANDTYAGVYSPGVPRHPHKQGHALAERIRKLPGLYNYAVLVEWAAKRAKGGMRESSAYDEQCRPRIPERAAETVDTYLRMTEQTTAIGNGLGFGTLFLWQPALLGGTRQLQPYEAGLLTDYSPVMAEAFAATHAVAQQRIAGTGYEHVRFIGHVFDTVPGPVYIDWCHTGPQGNAIIAEIMAQHILTSTGEAE